MLEAFQVSQHLAVADLVTRYVILLLLLASDQPVELYVFKLVELGCIDELDVLKGQRDLLLLSKPFAFLLHGDNLAMLKPTFEVFFLHGSLLSFMRLPRPGVLVVEGNGFLHGVADQVVLEVVLVIP